MLSRQLLFRGVNQAAALLEMVLGMLSSNWEKLQLEAAAVMLGSQLIPLPVWKVQVAAYKPATETSNTGNSHFPDLFNFCFLLGRLKT